MIFEPLRAAILEGMAEGLERFLELVEEPVEFDIGPVFIDSTRSELVDTRPVKEPGMTQIFMDYTGDSQGELGFLIDAGPCDRLISLLHGHDVASALRNDTLVEVGNLILNRVASCLSHHHSFALVTGIPFVGKAPFPSKRNGAVKLSR